MSLVRASLKSLLETEFLDPEVKATCINDSRERILSGRTNRVFDDFPPLMPSKVLLELTVQFVRILTNIKQVDQTDEGYILSDLKEKRELIKIQKKIIQIGCRELINDDGTINQDICILMQWDHQLTSKIDAIDLLCAYLHANNTAIMNQMIASINKHDKQYHAVCHYLNNYYHSWVIDTFKSLNIPYHARHDTNLNHDCSLDIGLSTSEKTALGIGIGAATLGGLAVLGYAIFKSAGNSNMSQDLSSQFSYPKI